MDGVHRETPPSNSRHTIRRNSSKKVRPFAARLPVESNRLAGQDDSSPSSGWSNRVSYPVLHLATRDMTADTSSWSRTSFSNDGGYRVGRTDPPPRDIGRHPPTRG